MDNKELLSRFIQNSKEKFKDKFDYSQATWNGYSTPLILINCETGESIKVSPKNHLRSQSGIPTETIIKNSYSKEDFIKKAEKIHGNNISYIGDYLGSHTKMEMYCNIHKTIFYQEPSIVLQGRCGCKQCASIAMSNSSAKKKFDINNSDNIKRLENLLQQYETFEEVGKILEISGHHVGIIARKLGLKSKQECNRLENIEKLKNFIKLGKTVSEIADYFEVTIQDIFYKLKKYNIPYCKSKGSFGEEIVYSWLSSCNAISNLTREFKCLDVHGRTGNGIYVDFVCTFEGKTYWIEYNGEQHYFPVKCFGGESIFNLQRKRDLEEKEYCKKNGILLIEIPYTLNTSKKIENFLEDVFLNRKSPYELIDYNKLY